MQGDRLVGGQRPRRRGPDHHADRTLARVSRDMFAARQKRRRIHHGETHVDGGRGLVHVFDLGLGQRRTAVAAPVHRLVAAHHVAVGNDAPERADDAGLEGKIHREIGMAPVADHAETNEILALPVHLHARVFTAGLAEFRRLDLDAGLADFFLDGMLDRQAVTIPARHVGRVEPAQGPGLDDDVLENLVDRVADVDVAVGIGRAVVQDIFRTVASLLRAASRRDRFPASA